MKTFPHIYTYPPDKAWRKNVMRDCLCTIKGRQIDTQQPEPKQDKSVRPFGSKDYQVEATYV